MNTNSPGASGPTHKAVEGVSGITTADAGLADMREEIQKRLDKASAQGEIDASRLDNQMSEVLEEHSLKVQIEERRRRLGLPSGLPRRSGPGGWPSSSLPTAGGSPTSSSGPRSLLPMAPRSSSMRK